MYDSFTFIRFVSRWLLALFLVLATYNPSGYSYFHWVVDGASGQWLSKLLVGLVLGIAYATFVLAAARALGVAGMAVWAALFASLTWLAVDVGIVTNLTLGTIATLSLVVFANVLGVGVSWSYVRGRLSGQQDTIDVTLP